MISAGILLAVVVVIHWCLFNVKITAQEQARGMEDADLLYHIYMEDDLAQVCAAEIERRRELVERIAK